MRAGMPAIKSDLDRARERQLAEATCRTSVRYCADPLFSIPRGTFDRRSEEWSWSVFSHLRGQAKWLERQERRWTPKRVAPDVSGIAPKVKTVILTDPDLQRGHRVHRDNEFARVEQNDAARDWLKSLGSSEALNGFEAVERYGGWSFWDRLLNSPKFEPPRKDEWDVSREMPIHVKSPQCLPAFAERWHGPFEERFSD
jgi:hypothetical protein